MRVLIPTLIFLLVTWRFTGTYAPYLYDWPAGRNQRLLTIYFKTLPADDGQETRMEKLLSRKSAGSKSFAFRALKRRAEQLIEDNYKKWQERPITEQEKLIERMLDIFDTIKAPQPSDALRIVEELSEQYTRYNRELNLIRSVVYKWYEERIQHGHESTWTPREKALLWYIDQAVKNEDENHKRRLLLRWFQLHPNQYIRASVLDDKLEQLKNEGYRPTAEETSEAERSYREVYGHLPERHGRIGPTHSKRRWSEKQKADLLYIYERSKNSPGNLCSNMKERWAQMYGYPSSHSGHTLSKQARRLIQVNYEPKSEYMEMAKTKYDNLPSLIVPDRKGKRILKEPDSEREFKIHTASAGQSSKQHRQNDYIPTPRFHPGHNIQQQQHIFGTGYHTANLQNSQEIDNDYSSSDHSIDKYLNLSYQDSDNTAKSNHYDLGGTSGYSHSP